MKASLVCLLSFSSFALAKTVEYHWNASWVTAAPDGYERPVIGINGVFPCPQIDVDVGDRLIVNLYNGLGNESTSLHWHGIHQKGTPYMDGATGTSQCPIAPGQSFTYDFVVDLPGTYWYHAHDMGQYPDGLWGPLIVHDCNYPFHYDEEIVLTFTDWYHDQMSGSGSGSGLVETYQSAAGEAADGTPNPSGGALVNLSKDTQIFVKPNTTYLLRVICPASYVGIAMVIDDHLLTTVEIDGVYVEPTVVNNNVSDLVRLAPGQRQSLLLHTKPNTMSNYPMQGILDVNMMFFDKGTVPTSGFNTNVSAWLVYNKTAPLPDPPVFYSLGNENFIDDITYKPLDNGTLLGPVNHQIIIETTATNISSISRFTINGTSYLPQKVPSLYTALTVGNQNSNPVVYGQTNPFVVKKDEIVEIVINNNNTNLHPWHLHGHQFQTLCRGLPNTGLFNGTYCDYSDTPMRRDTLMLQPQSFAVIRFKADNPGVWPLHCHIEFHMTSGLIGTIIEAPETFAESHFTIPADHLQVCKAYPMATAGNAAGNTCDPLNLNGAVTSVPANDYGAIYPPSS